MKSRDHGYRTSMTDLDEPKDEQAELRTELPQQAPGERPSTARTEAHEHVEDVDEMSEQSFPSSDPPSTWAG
ncbi:MAG: hypothetical protein JWP74_229 [Marmoricola sp.]|nr:hypothetical protein [Marmoricola sp.]